MKDNNRFSKFEHAFWNAYHAMTFIKYFFVSGIA